MLSVTQDFVKITQTETRSNYLITAALSHMSNSLEFIILVIYLETIEYSCVSFCVCVCV